MKDTSISFKQLSGWLKLAAIAGWITASIYTLAFLYGFLTGLAL